MSQNHSHIHVEGRLGGVIQYCSGCSKVSLRYGHLLLPMSRQRFTDFARFLEDACQRHFQQTEEVELRLRFSEVYLCLLDEEAEALLELVREAELEICRFQLEASFQLKTAAS